jgi:hypothetical protein
VSFADASQGLAAGGTLRATRGTSSNQYRWLGKSCRSHYVVLFTIIMALQMFECKVSVLGRDPGSLLAKLCVADPPPPVPLLPEGFYYFDRDW